MQSILKLNNKNKKILGFTLIEIMLALLMGIILLAGLMQVVLSAKAIYQKQTQLARLQENIAFATNILRQNIAMSGFAGCNKLVNLDFVDSANKNFNPNNFVIGYDSNSLPTFLKGLVIPNTDVIVIQKADSGQTRIVAPFPKKNATEIRVMENPATKNNKFLLLADCKNADLFLANNYIGNTIKLASGNISHDYTEQFADVTRFEEIAYFIGDTGRQDEHKNPIYALYMMTNQGNKEELVEGINSMKIMYGIDIGNGTISNYIATADVAKQNNWSKVLSVKITLGQNSNLIKMQNWDVIITLQQRNFS